MMRVIGSGLALACIVAGPAFGWSGSTRAGDYRVTATLDGNSRLQSVSLVPAAGVPAKAMQVHAWFIDSEGAILAPVPLALASADGPTLVAPGRGAAIPAHAAALVVLAQPAGLSRTARAANPALMAQIVLP